MILVWEKNYIFFLKYEFFVRLFFFSQCQIFSEKSAKGVRIFYSFPRGLFSQRITQGRTKTNKQSRLSSLFSEFYFSPFSLEKMSLTWEQWGCYTEKLLLLLLCHFKRKSKKTRISHEWPFIYVHFDFQSIFIYSSLHSLLPFNRGFKKSTAPLSFNFGKEPRLIDHRLFL